jgi:hypothetical protein
MYDVRRTELHELQVCDAGEADVEEGEEGV